MFIVPVIDVLVFCVEVKSLHVAFQILANEANAFDQVGNIQIELL